MPVKLKKGSKEAKAYMAHLRSLRGRGVCSKAALKGAGVYNKAALKGMGVYNKAALKGMGVYNKAALKGMGVKPKHLNSTIGKLLSWGMKHYRDGKTKGGSSISREAIRKALELAKLKNIWKNASKVIA